MPQEQEAVRHVLVAAGINVLNFGVQHTGPDGTVLRFDVNAQDAVSTWEKVRELTPDLGHYPAVCHDEHGTLAELPELNGGQPKQTVEAASELDVAAWFKERAASDPELYDDVEMGDWSESEPQSGWTVPFDISSGEPLDGVWIALVPTTSPWEVMAYLDYGGWNECPDATAQVAVHKYWYDKYGAEIVCVSGDVVEVRVTKPPTDRAAATALAREQFLFSGGDLVYQGYESMNALAAALVNANYWYFWWE